MFVSGRSLVMEPRPEHKRYERCFFQAIIMFVYLFGEQQI